MFPTIRAPLSALRARARSRALSGLFLRLRLGGFYYKRYTSFLLFFFWGPWGSSYILAQVRERQAMNIRRIHTTCNHVEVVSNHIQQGRQSPSTGFWILLKLLAAAVLCFHAVHLHQQSSHRASSDREDNDTVMETLSSASSLLSSTTTTTASRSSHRRLSEKEDRAENDGLSLPSEARGVRTKSIWKSSLRIYTSDRSYSPKLRPMRLNIGLNTTNPCRYENVCCCESDSGVLLARKETMRITRNRKSIVQLQVRSHPLREETIPPSNYFALILH